MIQQFHFWVFSKGNKNANSKRCMSEIPWQSNEQDSVLSLLRTQVRSLVRKLRSHSHTKRQKNYAHELQLLNPRGTTTEACMPQSLCSTVREATAMRSPCPSTREQTLLSTARESPRATKTRCNQKSITIKKKKNEILPFVKTWMDSWHHAT